VQERLQVGGAAAIANLQVAEPQQPGDGALHRRDAVVSMAIS
jgi:hypothetical protein